MNLREIIREAQTAEERVAEEFGQLAKTLPQKDRLRLVVEGFVNIASGHARTWRELRGALERKEKQ